MAPERFPFLTNGLDLKVRSLDVVAVTSSGDAWTLELSTPSGTAAAVPASVDMTPDAHVDDPVTPTVDLGRRRAHPALRRRPGQSSSRRAQRPTSAR